MIRVAIYTIPSQGKPLFDGPMDAVPREGESISPDSETGRSYEVRSVGWILDADPMVSPNVVIHVRG